MLHTTPRTSANRDESSHHTTPHGTRHRMARLPAPASAHRTGTRQSTPHRTAHSAGEDTSVGAEVSCIVRYHLTAYPECSFACPPLATALSSDGILIPALVPRLLPSRSAHHRARPHAPRAHPHAFPLARHSAQHLDLAFARPPTLPRLTPSSGVRSGSELLSQPRSPRVTPIFNLVSRQPDSPVESVLAPSPVILQSGRPRS
jgi:hypothetical protein